MVRFPLAGKPVRHIEGGLGKEEWPRTEERAENWGSRQGYVIVRSSMVGTMSMVMVNRVTSELEIVANRWRPINKYPESRS
jgi:hypothetical protein